MGEPSQGRRVVGLTDRCLCSDDRRQTLLTPPSTATSEPIIDELSSEAKKEKGD